MKQFLISFLIGVMGYWATYGVVSFIVDLIE